MPNPVHPLKKLLIFGGVVFAIGAALKSQDAAAATTGCNQDWRVCKDNEELMNSDNSILHDSIVACQIAANHQNKYGDGSWENLGWSKFAKFYGGDNYVKSGS